MSNKEVQKLSLKKFKIKSILPDSTILCLGRRRCFKYGTKVLMYDGSIKEIQDINPGDYVMGDKSEPRLVQCCHQGREKLYMVSDAFGGTYTVNGAHILSLYYTGMPKYMQILNTKFKVWWFDTSCLQMCFKYFNYNQNKDALAFIKSLSINRFIDIPVEKYVQLPLTLQHQLHGYKTSVNFQEKKVDVLPYIFGYKLSFDDNNTYNYKLYTMNSTRKRIEFALGFLYGTMNNEFLNDKYVVPIISVLNSVGIWDTHALTQEPCKTDIQQLITKLSKIKLYFLKNENTRIITTTPIQILPSEEDNFWGIEIDGNHRFVLSDYTVVHNSGKSWLVRDIFYHHKHIPTGVVFSSTEEASPFYSDFIPDCFIHSEYEPNLIEKIMTNQRKKIRKAKEKKLSETGKTPGNNVFVVLDDMLHDAQNWKKDTTIKNIFFNGRHYNLFFILTMQYPQGIPPELRSNIDYVFIFNEPSVQNRKKIYEAYAGMIPTQDYFNNILDACTQNHECLVIKTSGNSTDLRDQVFWYKAEYHNDFRVGHPMLWKFHRDNFNDKYVNDAEVVQEELDKLQSKFAKTKKLKVIVSRQGNLLGVNPE